MNDDGVVDERDLQLVIEAVFGMFDVAVNPDANRDGAVSAADVGAVIGHLD